MYVCINEGWWDSRPKFALAHSILYPVAISSITPHQRIIPKSNRKLTLIGVSAWDNWRNSPVAQHKAPCIPIALNTIVQLRKFSQFNGRSDILSCANEIKENVDQCIRFIDRETPIELVQYFSYESFEDVARCRTITRGPRGRSWIAEYTKAAQKRPYPLVAYCKGSLKITFGLGR